jgi:hypothetical protein
MRQKIDLFSSYQWELHMAVCNGLDVPQPPAHYSGPPPDSLIDTEVLQYMVDCKQNGILLSGPAAPQAPSLVDVPGFGRHQRQPSQHRRHNTRGVVPDSAGFVSAGTVQPPMFPLPRDDGVDSWLTSLLGFDIDVTDRSNGASRHNVNAFFDSMFSHLIEQDSTTGSGSHRRGARRRSRIQVPRFHRHHFSVDDGADYEHLLNLIEGVGDVSRGLDRRDINKLPVKTFQKADLATNEPVPECNICISEYEEGDRLRILQCLHKFHAKCIDKWLQVNRSCPTCREQVHVS